VSDLSEIRAVLASLSQEQRDSIRRAANLGLAALRKPEDVSLARWAHRNFYLSAESSQREEQWRAWPIQIGILHCMGDDNVEEFWFFKSARLGYTKCLLADLGYTAQHQRRNQGLWLPTDADRDDFVKTDLDPMLRDVNVMRDVLVKAAATSKESTLQQKKFLGSILKLRGGKASGNYRRLTLAKARADELDGFEQNVEGAGTPDALIRKRVEGATYPKLIFGSTGRRKGLSHIERGYDACDARFKFQITCPHCKEEHPLMWGGSKVRHGFKWDMQDPEGTVRHHCPHCFESIAQAEYLELARVGAWISECGQYRLRHWWDEKGEPSAEWTNPAGEPCLPPKRVGMHCWTAYSEQPGVTWGKIVREFLDALTAFKAGNRVPMVQWVNETKGETYEEEAEKADVNALQTRAKASGYVMRQVPHGALLLAAGVDVQNDRFEITVWAIGRGDETWAIDYIVIDANPALMSEWDRVWQALQAQYQHVGRAWMSLAGAAVDTGHFTHQAYAFVAKYHTRNSNFRLYAIKGSSNDGDPIKARSAKWVDINLHGRTIKKGTKLWMVGTDTAKDLFYGRIKVTQPGPGYVHFASDLPREFFEQYGNEKRIAVQLQGRTMFRWIHFRGSNEVVDTTMYSLFVFEALEVSKFSERKWQELERQVAPGLFDVSEYEPDNAVKPDAPAAPLEDAPAVTVTTRPPPEKPQQAAIRKPTAPAASPFASDGWLSRDR
jgi:phage terminase large subunit GpA-like protein